MKLLKNYDDYLLDMLVESTKQGIPLVFSERFLSLVLNINHPISETLKASSGESDHKNTYIDLDDSGLDKVSFITSSKAAEIINKDFEEKGLSGLVSDDTYISLKYNNRETYSKILTSNRSVTTIGKLINKLFPKKFEAGGRPGEDIQSFVDKFKSLRDTKDLELLESDDIVEYYKEEHHLEEKGTLGSSCMRYEECSEYIEFYAINSDVVSLLVMFDENEDGEKKVRARALVWKLSRPSDRYFMDRVYTIYPHDTERFIEYARENNWLYKEHQTSSSHEYIYDPSTESSSYKTLVVFDVNRSDSYPYMDTLKYFSNGMLSNDVDYFDRSDEIYELEDTGGGYEELERGHWSDHYGEYIDTDSDYVIWCELGDDYRYEDDAYYIEFYNQWATDTYVDNHMIECDYYDDSPYRERGDTVNVYGTNETACSDYAQFNLVYSEWLDEFLPPDRDVWSEYHNSNIYRPESVKVYVDEAQSNWDWRVDDEGDGDWWKWDRDGELYDSSVTEEELMEYNEFED